ncbi:MAG: exonuclease domain-containing protein, partial [Flavobacteriales bacterium]|nr:exonuclease domain-containing protein [Flavobacteriales bacterium]
MFQPDCVIVFDLEATCFRLRKPPAPEVIEIGAVKTDLIGNELSRYQAYVLPTRAPKLSKFCTKLTGIQQYQIDDADEFPLAVEDFKHWIFEGVNEPILTSWGRYDIRQLRNQSMEHFLPSFDL